MTLGARAFDVLVVLVERRERLVTKDELLETAWPGLVVEENNLQVQVSALRKILGPHAIATIPGRGYRFTARLEGDASPVNDRPPGTVERRKEVRPWLLPSLSEGPRLAAVVFTDVVGYSARMQRDETGTIVLVNADFARMRLLCGQHGGESLNTMGDGLLLCFPSALQAVTCALQIQHEFNARGTASVPGQELEHRIGVHLGDVFHLETGDVAGDGINIASRLESKAPPGGICLSQTVYDTVKGKIPMHAHFAGPETFKNIAEPVPIWLVMPEGRTVPISPKAIIRRDDIVALGLGLDTAVTSKPPHPVACSHNLPRDRTQFIGRERMLAECSQLLRGTRLLTLTGIGGSGKTRLALKAAETLRAEFADGVWFVDLASLQNAERVPLAVASTLGLREDPGKPLVESITGYLNNRRILLVLDNCEHVIDAAAELVDTLLTRCDQLILIATSRQGLGTTGEQIYPVRPMELPKALDFSSMQSADAVRLFVDRARLVDPAFALNVENVTAVAEICRRLDGIPLAIELAAARVNMLSVEQIYMKLDDRFRLLIGGKRVLPRHQTLLATIQWSYEQLEPGERKVLCQLSVFAGGWTLAGAACVASESIDEFDILNRLTQLADKSLISSEHDGEEVRYTMLESVRQYAQQRLDESGGRDEARARHLAFCLTLVPDLEAETDPAIENARARVDKERENLLAAHQWCGLAPERADAGLRLITGLRDYFLECGLAPLGHRLFVEATERLAARTATRLRCIALLDQALLALETNQYTAVQDAAGEALTIARFLDDPPLVALALFRLVALNTDLGRFALAENYLNEVMPIANALGGVTLMRARLWMADLRFKQGDLDMAEPLFLDVMHWCREDESQKQRWRVSPIFSILSVVALARGDALAARACLRNALATARSPFRARSLRFFLCVGSGVLAANQEWTLSARFHGIWRSMAEDTGVQLDAVEAAVIGPLMDRTREMLGDARFASEEAAGRLLTLDAAVAMANAWLDQSPPANDGSPQE